MTPLRVGLDQRLAAYRAGGIARYAIELGNALAPISEIHLTRFRHHRDLSATAGDMALRTPAHHRFEPLALGVELRVRRADIDLYHATDVVAPRWVGRPVVATVHDLAFLRWPDQLSRDSLAYYRKVEHQADRTAHWIVPSEWTRDELTALLGIPSDDITVIPHGISRFVDSGSITPRDRRAPYLLAVGTVEPRKRYDLLLDAYERLKPRPQLHIAGAPGWNTTALQQRLKSTDGVHWHQTASDAEVNDLLSNALALLLPSLAEGFGLGALEAMARGTPVISSGLGALSEVTGPAAQVPDRDTPAAWAEAIEQVIHDESTWQRLSESGYRRSRAFSWDAAAAATADVYRRVAG